MAFGRALLTWLSGVLASTPALVVLAAG